MNLSGELGSAAGVGRCLDGAVGALTTVFGQVAEQRVHAIESGSVDDVSAGPLLRHQPGVGEFLEVERQGVRRDAQPLGHGPGRQSGRPSDDERSEHLQAYGLREGCQRLDDVFLFHRSTIVEVWNCCQPTEPSIGMVQSKESAAQFRPAGYVDRRLVRAPAPKPTVASGRFWPIAALGPPAAFDPLADISRCYQIGRKLPLKIRSLRRVIPSKDAPEGGLGHPGHDPFLHDALIQPLRVSARATRASDVDDKVIR